MDIRELYVTITKELERLDCAGDEDAQTACLRTLQSAMDQYKAHQTRNDLKSLQSFFDRDGRDAINLPELGYLTSEGIEISLRQDTSLKLFFDNTSTVILGGEVLLEEGLSRPEDIN